MADNVSSLFNPGNQNIFGAKEELNRRVEENYRRMLNRLAERTSSGKPMPPEITSAIRSVDNLGFDSPGQAIRAIRQHPDWMARWDIDPRRSVPEANLVRLVMHYLKTGEAPSSPSGGGGGMGGGGGKLLPFSGGSMFDQAIGGMTKNTVGRTPLG